MPLTTDETLRELKIQLQEKSVTIANEEFEKRKIEILRSLKLLLKA